MNLELTGKHVLITGGTRGIGLAMARAFTGEGAVVHVIARNPPAADDPNVFSYACDVTDGEALNAAVPEILRNSGGRLDVLVCNAGSGAGTLEAIPSQDEWYRLWNLNFDGALNTARVFESVLLESGGNVVFISSIAGMEYLGAPTAYATAKAALLALASNLSAKWAPGVRVNTVAPGNIYFEGGTWDRKMQENREAVDKMLKERVALQRLGKPEEIADLVLFLASPRASFITGTCVVADGGQTLSYR